MSPTLVEAPPAGDGWITELKWDGYRTLVVKDDRGSRAYPQCRDWTAKYWPITLTAEVLPCRSAVIHGEMVVLDAAGRSSDRLCKRMQEAAKPSRREAGAGIEWMEPWIKG